MKSSIKIISIVLVSCFVIYGALLLIREHMFSDEKMFEQATVTLMNETRDALARYKSACGRYPPTLADLTVASATCEAFEPRAKDRFDGIDRWNHAYEYVVTRDGYTLRSMGNSWIEATSGEAAKVVRGDN